jgi:hypothetical protein
VQGFSLGGPNFNIALGGEKFLELLSLMDEGEIVMFLKRILKINLELRERYEQAIVLRPLPKY